MSVTKFPNGISTGSLEVSGASTFDAMGVTGAATLGALTATAGQVRQAVQTLAATGAITITSGLVLLSHTGTVIAATKAAPVAGDVLYIINTSASGTAAHTVTLPEGVTWNGTNRIATLDAPGEALLAVAVSATRFVVLVNVGTVAFS